MNVKFLSNRINISWKSDGACNSVLKNFGNDCKPLAEFFSTENAPADFSAGALMSSYLYIASIFAE